MDEYGKYFGNPDLTSAEVQTLLSYTVLFVLSLIIIFFKSKRKVSDLLAFYGIFWIITQNTYHLQHGEQLDQYDSMLFLMIQALIAFIFAWFMVASKSVDKYGIVIFGGEAPAWYRAYWIGLSIFIFTTIYLVVSIFTNQIPDNYVLTSSYPDMNSKETVLAFAYILSGILFAVSYRGAYSGKRR